MALDHLQFEEIQRASFARRVGKALYLEAAAISPDAVDAVAAVLNRMEARRDSDLTLVGEEFARAMMADHATDFLVKLPGV